MKKLFLLWILILLCFNTRAVERSEQQMIDAAVQILKGNQTRSIGNSELKEYLSLSKLKVYGYDDGGFAVVTSDDRFNSVIGYSSSRYEETIPCGLNWWIETVNANMSNSVFSESKKNATRSGSAVSPLLTSIWGQERPFNDDCTFTNNNKTYQCVTGCIATALAQVMYYYKFPERGTGSNTYDIKYNNDFTITYSEDFSNSVYDWENMLDSYQSYKNNKTKDSHTRAVSKLMWDCGVATRTSFSDATHGSSSSLQRVENAMKTYFYYDESTKYYVRSNFDKNEWMRMIYEELDKGRPILYSGADSEGNNSVGHAFVLHGYDSYGNIYINWGWNGYCDGYFNIDLLNPSNDNFSKRQAMVIAKPGNNSTAPQLQTLTISVKGSGTVYYGGMEGIQIREDNQSFKVKEGSTAVLLISPDIGSKIKSVKVNNKDVTSSVDGNNYTIDNIRSSIDVKIEFDVSSDISTSSYNTYLTCINTSTSTSVVGSTVTRSIGFEIMNSGKEAIIINKLIARNPDTNEIILNSTDTSVLGELKGGNVKSLSFKVSKDVSPVYEMEYTLNNKRYVYDMTKYKILTLSSNYSGHIYYSDIAVGTNARRFSVEPASNVTIELIPNDGSEFSKLMSGSTDVTKDVVNNKYTIKNISSNITLKATFNALNSIDGHEYVDLGLPSGKYWSTMNYGANKPEEFGDYYSSISRATSNNWGGNWKCPDKDEMQELIDRCEWTWTELNGVKGYSIKGPNNNKIFLPAAGKKDFVSGNKEVGSTAYYFTSSKGDFGDVWILKNRKLYTTHIILEEFPVRPISRIHKEPTMYTLSVKAKGGGFAVYGDEKIKDNTSTYKIQEGSEVMIKFEPDKDNNIKVLKENGNDILSKLSSNKYVIKTFSKNTEIEVEFEYVAPTLYSLLYMVDGDVYKKYELEEGSAITPEAEPTKEGYTFSGWSEIPSTMPAKDVTITGTFTVNKYKLTYMVDGEVYKIYEIEYGTTIIPEEAPHKDGCTFSGWSEIPSTMPAKDVTIIGTFTKGTYTLTYVVDGETYKTVNYEFGAAITPEAEPLKEGYSFSGWNNLPTTMPAENITVTGTFTINKYKLIYLVDGAVYKTYDIEYGAAITPEETPSKQGYEFTGWSWIPSKMPAEDVVITGSFTQIKVTQENVNYEIDGDVVVIKNSGSATGKVKIESSVVINGYTYQVTVISEGAFQNCTGLTSVDIPNSVKTIAAHAFDGCSGLREIKIGKGIGEIGSKAFANISKKGAKTRAEDDNRLHVYCEAEVIPSTASDAFDGTPINEATLHVIDELVGVYKLVMPWNAFGSVVGLSTAINSISINHPNARIYDMQCNRIDNLQKGVNIIRLEDGRTKKVIVK